jgi:Zn-dependent protease
MFGRRIRLFTIQGFEVGIDWSWFVIALLVVWSLGRGLFPQFFPGMEPGTYWTMAIVGAAGLFGSIVLHELGHAVEARRNGVEMRGITLFVFGGVAEMTREPTSAAAEFRIAVAGPIVSVGLALVAYGGYWVSGRWEGPTAVTAVLWYLWLINGLLVMFNLIPAFPLDGGRILRSILWHYGKSLRWATKIASGIGGVFGLVLIGLGVLSLFTGNFIGGLWWFVLGMFLRGAAQMSYQQVLVRRALEGEPVWKFMQSEPHSVERHISVGDLVEDHIYRFHHKMFPVTDQGRLVGCVSTQDVKQLPREEWERHTVGEVSRRCGEENTIRPGSDAMEALSKMQRHNQSRLMVVEDGELRGVITLRDLMKLMALKVELEEESGRWSRAA